MGVGQGGVPGVTGDRVLGFTAHSPWGPEAAAPGGQKGGDTLDNEPSISPQRPGTHALLPPPGTPVPPFAGRSGSPAHLTAGIRGPGAQRPPPSQGFTLRPACYQPPLTTWGRPQPQHQAPLLTLWTAAAAPPGHRVGERGKSMSQLGGWTGSEASPSVELSCVLEGSLCRTRVCRALPTLPNGGCPRCRQENSSECGPPV